MQNLKKQIDELESKFNFHRVKKVKAQEMEDKIKAQIITLRGQIKKLREEQKQRRQQEEQQQQQQILSELEAKYAEDFRHGYCK